ncbi:MAG: MFS transporter [Thermaerobacter sp.]|nr:MFS transporter [Thermaerobacter sp.]
MANDLSHYPRAFWVLFAGRLFNSIGTSLIFPFLTVYLHATLHVSLAIVGLVLLGQGAAQVIAVIVGGLLADSWGRLPTMVLSLLAGAAASIALAFVHAPIWIVLLIILRGGLLPLFAPAAQALVADIVPKEKLYPAFSIQRVAANAGIILGPMLGAFLLQHSFAILFLLSGLIAAVFGLAAPALLRGVQPAPQHASQSIGSGLSLALLRDRYLLAIVGLLVLVSLAYSQLYWVVPGYLTIYLHLPAADFGFLAAENAVLVVLFQMPMTRLSRNWQPATAIAVGASLYGVGFLSMAPLGSFLPFFIPVAVITIGEILLQPSVTALVVSRAQATDRGKALGLLTLANRSGSGIGPLLGGTLLTYGGPWVLFTGTALVAGIAAGGYARLRHHVEGAA